MATAKTLKQALELFLEDDGMIDRLEADALYDLILQDGKITEAEKDFLVEAIRTNHFDERALSTLEALVTHYRRRAAHR